MIFKNVKLNNQIKNIKVKNGIITAISDKIDESSDKVHDCQNMTILPSLGNAHTHAAMTLMRGYADDMELFKWLSEYIWPLESLLTEEDVYWGVRLACLEMIKTGTTCFNDMYWHTDACIKAVDDAGIRAVISQVFLDNTDNDLSDAQIKATKSFFKKNTDSNMIKYAIGPHAIYTVSQKSLKWIAQYSKENDKLVHIHLAETEKEVSDCIKATGMTPVKYLDSLNFIDHNSILAHGIWLTEEEMKIIADRGATIVHNPISNLKLASGFIKYPLLKKYGVRIALGTDGCSSNNNLSMLEEMKIASLVTKHLTKDPTAYSAKDVFNDATQSVYEALKINSGIIEVGKNADFMLLKNNNFLLTPGFNSLSDLIYSADSSSIDTLVCNGKIVMGNGKVEDEDKIINNVKRVVQQLIERKGI